MEETELSCAPVQFHLELGRHVHQSEQLLLRAHPLLVKICLNNLLKNAALYTLNHQAVVRLDAQYHQVVVEVANLGAAALDSSLVFQPFYRETGQRRREGHGLGLSIVKEIVDSLRGTIVYSFEEGQHCFRLTLPQA
ncbi:MAG: sensor histidine kinase [Cytophagales bacterium]|nr:sensor histidine kinase [Cytophagales bacterium]